MKFTIAAVLSAVASSAYAQLATGATAGVAIAKPALGDVVNAGTTLNITWYPIEGTANPSANINSIALMSGGSAALDTIIPNILSAPIPTSPAWYLWNIPLDVATMPSYSLALQGDNGASTYSSYFTIMTAAAGAQTNYTSAPPATNAGTGSGSTTNGGNASTSNGATAGNSTTSADGAKTTESAANSLKAGLFGAGVAGAVALLL